MSEGTRKNPVMSRVLDYVLNVWSTYIKDEEINPFFLRRNELSAEQGCLLWGLCVIIPPQYRERILQELHDGHPGMCRMTAIARSYVWWPNMDMDIQGTVQAYGACQAVRNQAPVAPLHPWKWPTRPWSRIYLDFFFKEGKIMLIVIDAHSKWIAVCPMTNTDAEHTIEELRILMAEYSLPEEVVSDNGPQFTSELFKEFLKMNGIKQTLVPPYNPA